MRFVMLVPKSLDPVARGRKMPLPDPRPSARIAKLFPQTEPAKESINSRGAKSVDASAMGAGTAPVAPTASPGSRPHIETNVETSKTSLKTRRQDVDRQPYDRRYRRQ
jgi:membrane-bound lytic murein transglycosylase A